MRIRLELQICRYFDVETMHRLLLDPLSKELKDNGAAISIMPVYSFNPDEKFSLKTIDLGNKRAHLQFIKITLSVISVDIAIDDIKRFLSSKELLSASRLKFESDNYNLLQLL